MHLIQADQGQALQLPHLNAAPFSQLMVPGHYQHQLITGVGRHLQQKSSS